MDPPARETIDLPALRKSVTQRLAQAGIRDAAGDADVLIGAALGVNRASVLSEPRIDTNAGSLALMDNFVARRCEREPVSRILGRRSFWTLDLSINGHVLDPRADSETLVEAATKLLAPRRHERLRILDLGTGSGALLCALLFEFPQATGLGTDISAEACRAAIVNLEACNLAGRGQVQQADWFTGLEERFDLIVSNPPYIPTGVIGELEPEVRLWDPPAALDGGPDGLAAYRILSGNAPRFLNPGAILLLETGFDQRAAVRELLIGAGLGKTEVFDDLGGRHRAVAGMMPSA